MAFVVAGTILTASAVSPQGDAPEGRILLEAYDRGEYAEVVRRLETIDNIGRLDRIDADLKRLAQSWIAAADIADQRRRAFVAGALSLEVTHVLVERESWANANRGGSHLPNLQAVLQLRRLIADQRGPADEIEHAWTLAQLATWQEWNVWARSVHGDSWLTPEPVWAVLLGAPPLNQLAGIQGAFGAGGYLAEVLARFPGDPRLLLAVAEGHESIATRCPTQYCFDEMNSATLADLHRRAAARPPELADPVLAESQRSFAFASANLKAFDQLLPVAAEFAAVANANPTVRDEAMVHMGYLAIRAARPDAALAPLTTASTSIDAFVRYLADYFSGRAFEMLGDRAQAIAAYRRALVTIPSTPSASTLLAAQLFMSEDAGDRYEAHAVLGAAKDADPGRDPWERYWYGDARLWAVYMDNLRERLRK